MANRRIDDLDDVDRKILLYIAAHRDLHDEGPTWREISQAVGLPSVRNHLWTLSRRKHLWFVHNRPRSTNIKYQTRKALDMGYQAAT